jgi:hypothetical protein
MKELLNAVLLIWPIILIWVVGVFILFIAKEKENIKRVEPVKPIVFEPSIKIGSASEDSQKIQPIKASVKTKAKIKNKK